MVASIETCRSCSSPEITPILSLGDQYITNFLSDGQEKNQGVKVPLETVLCGDCKLLQLRHNAPPEEMWGDQYWYKSGISSTIRKDLEDIVNKSKKLKVLGRGDFVVDIGSNDGTLLDFYGPDVVSVGFEPSKNVAKEAENKGHTIFNDFFNYERFEERFFNQKAKIITAISMFYDLEDPNKFLRDAASLLDDDGLFVIQQNYLVTMLEQNAFDNISHEHREYYSLNSLNHLLKRHDLEVFDVEQNGINGGSIRTYIRKKGSNLEGFPDAEKRVDSLLEREDVLGLNTLKPYQDFAGRISGIKDELMSFIVREKSKGRKIGIYGASTRGNVALQYFGLNPELIEAIADKNPDKWGRKTVGSLIPIISPEEMRIRNPDYLLVNTWHFFDEVKEQENAYHDAGGRFVTALPYFRVE